MRKNLIFIIIILAAVIFGGMSAMWWLQASNARKNIEAGIADFNTGPVKLSYDAIETSGFPLKLVVSLINPKLNGRVDVLLDPNKQRALPEWDENAALQGTASLSIDALSSKYTFVMNGAWKNTSTLNGQPVALASKADISAQCSLVLNRAGGWASSLWNFSALKDHSNEFMSDLRLFDCALGDLAIVEPQTGATLAQSGAQRLYISSDPKGDKREIRFYLKGADSFVTPDGDRVFAAYSRAFSPQTMPTMLSAYGKQNTEVDFTYIGPLDWTGDPRIAPVEIHLSKFAITNDAYNINASFDLSNAADAQKQSARVAFTSEANFNQPYSALLHDAVRSMITDLLAQQKIPAPLPPSIKNYTPDSLYALLAPAIPDFHTFGKCTAALDLSYQGGAGFSGGDFTLSNLELSVAQYGITAKGTGKRAPGALMPAVNMTFNCRNCLQMVDDVAGYTSHIQSITGALSPEKPVMPLNTATIEGYKNFLQALASDEGGGNFSFVILSDGKMGVTINNKHMDEVLMLYHKLVPEQR
jgi:hypothetical protein